MMYSKQFRWLPSLIMTVAILSLLTGCAAFSPFAISDNLHENTSSEMSPDSSNSLTGDQLRAETVLELTPLWMASADSAYASGDSISAEASTMQSILALQKIVLDMPETFRSVLIDSLSIWMQSYESRFGPIEDEIIATDEGLAGLLLEHQLSDNTLELVEADSFVVVIDTSIIDVDRLPEIPDVTNKKVERMIEYFTKNTRGRKAMTIWLSRAGEMIPRMQPILRQHGMPDDLVYLSMIESGFRTDARSWARAVGPWQFVSRTGKAFDLENDWWYDERRDPELATAAAAKYLRQLYEHLDDWYLAFASYNYGEGRVKRHCRRGNTRDYWKLTKLPRETRNYIPTYLAARRIAKDPESYGFDPIKFVKIDNRDAVEVNEPIELGALAEALEVELSTLQKMNPALIRWCTPPTRKSTMVNIPKGYADKFEERMASIPSEKKTSWTRHRVRSGESLSAIASNYNSSLQAIMDVPANKLRNPNRIKEGQYLLIPVAPGGLKGNYANLYAMSDPELPDGTSKRTHVVRRGQTLSQIAERYHVGLSKLLRWNRLSKRSMIYPGQKLVLYQRNSGTQSQVYSQKNRTSASPNGGATTSGTKPAADIVYDNTIKSGNEYIYTVQRGDSPWTISKMFAVSSTQLLSYNNLSSRSMIHPGDTLRIPASAVTLSSLVYPVQTGDTLWEIATKFNVSIGELKSWNNIRNVNKLTPGDQLVVYLKGSDNETNQ